MVKKCDMKCSECKYWRRKPDANGYCTCLWPTKPCEQTRRYKAKQKRNKKKLEMYGKGAKKMRSTGLKSGKNNV